MSFKFNWRFFDLEELEAKCRSSLTESIATVSRPPVIVKPMRVTAIEFGTVPPELAFHSIPSVSLKRAHVVFQLRYSGDASLTLETSIEANPLREPYFDPELPAFVQPKVIAATDSLVLPFRLKLEDIVLDTLVDVVYTPSGVVVNFHDDPLKAVGAESSLDMIPGVKPLLSGLLRQSITASFYEDVPESVWTVSSPHKRPPDPWFGARRWSQHNNKFVRFASFIVNSLGAKSRQYRPPFATLALNVETPQLRLPRAILSRASLPHLHRSFTAAAHSANLTPQSLTSLFEAGSDVVSLRSSAAASSQSAHQRPKRRVISLRHLQHAADAAPDASPGAGSEKSPTRRASARTDGGPSSAQPLASPPRLRLPGEHHDGKVLGRSRPPAASAESVTPPVFDSDDGGTGTDTDQEPDWLAESLKPLEPLERLSIPDAPHRRFSSPVESRLDRRRRHLPSKTRTASMQPTNTPPLVQSAAPRPSRAPHSPKSPRSPRARLVSTNDLMNK